MANRPARRRRSSDPVADLNDVDRMRFECAVRDLHGHFDVERVRQETDEWLAEWAGNALFYRNNCLAAGSVQNAASWEVDRRRIEAERARRLPLSVVR